MAKNKILSFFQRVLRGYRRLSMRQRSLVWVILLVLLLVVFPSFISYEVRQAHGPAKMYFTTTVERPAVGNTFPVELRVQTTGQAINAVGSEVHFNPLYLEVTSMTTDTSFCSFYLDNTFDNIKGIVRVDCGLPSPGFTGDSLVAHLNMRAKIPGNTSMTVNPSTTNVLANDGKGTNIINGYPHLDLDIQQLF